MRVRPYSRILRFVSCGTLFFFSWVYLSLFEIPAAYAVESRGTKGLKAEQSRQEQQKTTEEKFQESLDRIRETGEDRSKLKAERSELEKLDTELQKQFKEVEAKIEKLPEVIKQRHRDFTKKYAQSMGTLKKHLDIVEKAKTDAEVKVAAAKTKAFLESVRPQKRHIALDPNRLPHQNRALKTKWHEPRSKEQFERDFPQQKSQGKKKIAGGFDFHSAIRNPQSEISYKPILLAFNETASDVPFTLGVQSLDLKSEIGDLQTQIAFSDSAPILLAQATEQPSADDLAEVPGEIEFTPAIRALAAQLGYSPLRIFEHIRNSIEYAPVYGSIQGADMCLQSKICNDTDTASLLIALFRVSGVYAHYEYSTIEIPIEKAMNWVGGVTDPKMVGTILATNGIPAKMLISGGTYKAVQLEHTSVRAFIDMIPSRGSVHKFGDTWVPLDPSFKQYTYTQGIDIASAVPFDAQSFANQIQSTATINPDGSVTNVNSALVQQTMQGYQTQVQNYIQQNYPNATVGDVIGKKEIIQQNYPILIGTLPYKTVQVGSEFITVPDNLRETMSFNILDPTGASAGLTYTTGMPQIAGKKITLSFSPATANDQAVIESLLPTPHADGTPIQPSELPSSFSAYLINLKPELRIDGLIVATGAPSMMGSEQSFTMLLNEPGIGISNIDYIVTAGQYSGIGVDTGRIGADRINALKAKLVATKTKLEAKNYAGITKEDIVGDLLYTTITAYFAQLDLNDELGATNEGVIRYRGTSIGMFFNVLNVQKIFGVPTSVGSSAMMMDVKKITQAVFCKDGKMDSVKKYMLESGSNSSALENAVPEQLYSQPTNPVYGISAVIALQLANNQGIPIYKVNQSNGRLAALFSLVVV